MPGSPTHSETEKPPEPAQAASASAASGANRQAGARTYAYRRMNSAIRGAMVSRHRLPLKMP